MCHEITILKALVAEHAHFTHPGNTGVVGEEVGGKHGEDGVEMILAHNAFNLDVAALQVTHSLSSGASAVNSGDRVPLDADD